MQSATLALLTVVTPAMAPPPIGFDTRLADKTIAPAYVTFGIRADGHVERTTLNPVAPRICRSGRSTPSPDPRCHER